MLKPTIPANGLLGYICCVGFTGAHNASKITFFPTGLERIPELNLSLVPGSTGLYAGGLGAYQASGTIIFQQEGDSWFIPFSSAFNPEFDLTNSTQTDQGAPAIYISGIADTNSLITAQQALRLTLVVSTFSVILLQPVLEAILLKDRRPGDL